MADLLIKNMEMPERCRGCRFHHIHKIWSKNIYLHECDAQMLAEETEGMEAVKLPKACPLVALPEHGDLKDVSILLRYLSHMHGATEHDNDLLREFEKMIRECPTVVEATE